MMRAEYQRQLRNLLKLLIWGSDRFSKEEIQEHIDLLNNKINQLEGQHMKVDFGASIKQDEEQFDLGKGDYFKFKEGDNRIRICSDMVGYESVYKGQSNVKFVTLVLDRADKKVKVAFLPFTIKKIIAKYQTDPEYAFEEVPLPFDITVNAVNAGDIKVKYTVTPARSNVPLTPEELALVEAAGDVQEIVKKLKESQTVEQEQGADEQPFISDKDLPTIQQEENVNEGVTDADLKEAGLV